MNGSRSRFMGACSIFAILSVVALDSCASLRLGPLRAPPRPAAIVGEWIDLSHTTPQDTSLWILRSDGYEGSAHILIRRDAAGSAQVKQTERRDGTWYLEGAMTNAAKRAICWSRRPGRFGSTCLSFVLDTLRGDSGARRRLTIHGFLGERHMGDRELLERRADSIR